MRKIQLSEYRKAASVFAEIFKDYKAYDLFFKKNKLQKFKIYQFFLYECFISANYIYEFDDFKSLCAIKTPMDKDQEICGFFNNPLNKLIFNISTSKYSKNLAKKYMNFAENIANKYYNPKTDCYIKNIGVIKSERGKGYLKKMINKICKDKPIFLETHKESNVKMYEHLGFYVCETQIFNGIKHYAMKRD